MDYCDIEYLEQYGGFTNASEAERAMLAVHITQASDMIDRHCGRKFGIPTGEAAQTRTFTIENGLLDPNYGRVLWLDEDCYATVTIATVAAGVTLTWMPALPPYYAIIRDTGSWEDPTTITNYWAYANTPPATIVNETARLAMAIYDQRVNRGGDAGRGLYGLPQPNAETLAPYKRVRLP